MPDTLWHKQLLQLCIYVSITDTKIISNMNFKWIFSFKCYNCLKLCHILVCFIFFYWNFSLQIFFLILWLYHIHFFCLPNHNVYRVLSFSPERHFLEYYFFGSNLLLCKAIILGFFRLLCQIRYTVFWI